MFEVWVIKFFFFFLLNFIFIEAYIKLYCQTKLLTVMNMKENINLIFNILLILSAFDIKITVEKLCISPSNYSVV